MVLITLSKKHTPLSLQDSTEVSACCIHGRDSEMSDAN